MSAQPNREVALFSAALELPASERAAYLNEACADDPALRQRLEELLRIHQDAITFLENKAPAAQESPIGAVLDPTIRLSTSPSEKAGDRIGRYKLLQQIGEGGCGVVYMAEQEEPVRRRVALKVIKLGMDTKQVIARFEAERQALALMDHPNIAKVLDAGATDTGRPFFVMELVRGIKITDYSDENNLSTEDRLDLFIQVCHAVQHAHQKGIIHRDIKPSNILVTVSEPGAPGCPKVIDFGIAKATTGQRLTDKTVFTAFEQFIGTPAYMSPEQALMTSLDIDTRTDIYALGVLLYELLTGKTPLDQKELLAAGLEEMRRTIREKEPVRPSTRLSTMLEEELTTTAKHRHTQAPKLIHLVRGDLDWIVMKCLEKDRTRRYETANGLANDVLRHLNCEPVVARPPSRLYEFQKTVRRHKFGFAAAAALIIVLALGVLVSTMQAVRATHAEAEQLRLRLEAEQARDRETRQRKAAEVREKAARARFLLDSGEFQRADKLLNGLSLDSFDATIGDVGVLHVLADWNVARGNWKEAADALGAFLKLAPLDQGNAQEMSRDLVRCGCLLLEAGETEAYENLRRNTLRLQVPDDYMRAFRIAQLALLGPIQGDSAARISPYISKVRASPAQWPEGAQWESFLFALFELRQGNYAQAVAYCGDATKGSPSCAACSLAILAAAQQRLNHPARATLAQCEAYVASSANRIKALDQFWSDWIFAKILQREAIALIEGHTNSPSGQRDLASIPARDPAASANLINLSSFYNASLTGNWHGKRSGDLSELPKGIQTFAGVQFDARGLIQLAAPVGGGPGRYPTEVRDIPIHRACHRLHFLHAAIYGAGAPDGLKIGSYIVHCASGTQSEFPILIGKSLADWWTQPDEQDKTFTIAWVGQNPESRRRGKTIRLFKSTWENPAPDETIRTIDFIGSQKGPAPFLVAITAEP